VADASLPGQLYLRVWGSHRFWTGMAPMLPLTLTTAPGMPVAGSQPPKILARWTSQAHTLRAAGHPAGPSGVPECR
jgi:hypothetical protein